MMIEISRPMTNGIRLKLDDKISEQIKFWLTWRSNLCTSVTGITQKSVKNLIYRTTI